MEQYLVDTNAISDYFSNSFSSTGSNKMDEIIDNIPNISIISKIELLCWKSNSISEKLIQSFISDSVVFDLSDDIVSKCIEIRRKKSIKIPDAIIAATAIIFDLILITNNEKDFMNIKGLKTLNLKNQ